MTEYIHPRYIPDRRRSCQRSGDTLLSLRASATCPRQMQRRIPGLADHGFSAAALIGQARVPDREAITYDFLVFNKADDAYDAFAFRTNQRVHFVYFLNQPCPVFPERFIVFMRFENTGDGIVCSRLFSFSARDIAVIAVVSDHLFATVGNMRTHGRQPVHWGKFLLARPSLAV